MVLFTKLISLHDVSVTVLQMFTSVRVFRLSNANLTNQGLNKIFTDLCENLLKVRNPYCSVSDYTICGVMSTVALFSVYSNMLLSVVVF